MPCLKKLINYNVSLPRIFIFLEMICFISYIFIFSNTILNMVSNMNLKMVSNTILNMILNLVLKMILNMVLNKVLNMVLTMILNMVLNMVLNFVLIINSSRNTNLISTKQFVCFSFYINSFFKARLRLYSKVFFHSCDRFELKSN